MNETGGTVRVSGLIKFAYEVRSADCNVFSVEELVRQIGDDKIGWFIDHYLGQINPHEDNEDDYEKYVVVEFTTDPKSGFEIHQVEEVVEKYNVPDPDCGHGVYYIEDDGNSRCTNCGGDYARIIEWREQ